MVFIIFGTLGPFAIRIFRFFSRKSLISPMYSPSFFHILRTNGCYEISKCPPVYIFQHHDTVQNSHFSFAIRFPQYISRIFFKTLGSAFFLVLCDFFSKTDVWKLPLTLTKTKSFPSIEDSSLTVFCTMRHTGDFFEIHFETFHLIFFIF